MYNSQEIAERIKLMAKAKGCSVSSVLAECGLGKNTVAKIGQGTDILTLNFAKIADCLDCSVDYLLDRQSGADHLSPDEEILIALYRTLNLQGREKVSSYVHDLTDMDKYKK